MASEAASPAVLPRCPECGWETHRPLRQARPASLRWRRRAVALWVLALAAAAAVILGRGATTTGFGFGTPSPRVLLPPVTLADVTRIAAGEGDGAGDDLVRRVLDAATVFYADVTDLWGVDAAFVTPGAGRTESRGVGWPTDWVRRVRYPVYEDAIRGSGSVQSKTDPKARPPGPYEIPSNMAAVPPMPRWQWQGRELVYRPPPEETGGVFTTTQLRFPALAVPAGILIFLWFALAALILLRERRKGSAPGLRRVRVYAVLAAAIAILGLAAWRARSESKDIRLNPKLTQRGQPPGPVYWSRSGFSRLGKSRGEIGALEGRPDGAGVLAREILRVAGSPAGSPEALYLAVASDPSVVITEPRSQMTSITNEFPALMINREYYTRRPDFGAVETVPHPAGISVASDYGFWSATFPSADPERPTLRVIASPEMLGMLVVGVWVAGLAAWYLLVGLTLVRIRRRHARGECPRCGYEVRATS